MSDRLGHKQTAVMLALMALAREVTNPELRDIAGFGIERKDREELNDLHLVDSRPQGRTHVHKLTDKGKAWCGEELDKRTAPPSRIRSSMVSAMYLVLGGVSDHLRREGLNPAEIFTPQAEVTREEIEKRIRDAYRGLARSPRDWVGLVELRPRLGDAPRDEVDAVLKELSRTGQGHLVPESNRKALTAADQEAAIRLGGEDNHLISIEVS